jgi:uncharacterized LabA/DUF88 family protein
LRDRIQSLERQLAHAARLPQLEADNAQLQARIDELTRTVDKLTRDHAAALDDVTEREQEALRRVSALRADLHDARRALAHVPEEKVASGARVGVFIDSTNLSASMRREHNGKLDFGALLDALVDGRTRAAAVVFLVNGDVDDAGVFHAFAHHLRAAGYETREKRPKVRADGSRKADWDMGIAMEILDRLDDIDVVVLGSGDGDFVPLVQRLRRAGKRVEVAAFRASTDEALVRAADSMLFLDARFRMTT